MKMLTLLVAAGLIFLATPDPSHAGDPPVLPDLDHDAIASRAASVPPDSEYVEVLPSRLAECTDLARPYANSGVTSHLIESMVIRMTCLQAMLFKLAQIYFHPEAYGPDGLKPRFERLRREVFDFYQDLYTGTPDTGTPDCFEAAFGRSCGTIFDSLEPRHAYVHFLRDLVEMTALRTLRIRDVGAWRKAWAEAGAP